MRDTSDFTIREAADADVSAVAALGHRFYREAGWDDVAEWDAHSIGVTLRNMVAGEGGIVLVLEREGVIRGMAGGLVYPLYFNHTHLTGQELFWWVNPIERAGAGIALLDALETAARERGAQSWSMLALDTLRPDVVGALYRRRGYRPSERSFIKRLAA